MDRVSVVAAAAAALLFSACGQAGIVARPGSGGVVLRAQPAGPIVARMGPRTEFGSPLVFAVAARRGGWLGVISPSMPNGRLAWVDARTVRTSRVKVKIVVSLSARTLTLRGGKTVLTRIDVGIGAAGSPTPPGTYAVTDKLSGTQYGGVYGCCILALSGHQPRPPRGWTGSDTRLAIHGGAQGAVSGGCLHASTTALRFLMAHVPLGTRVTIRR